MLAKSDSPDSTWAWLLDTLAEFGREWEQQSPEQQDRVYAQSIADSFNAAMLGLGSEQPETDRLPK
jgi:hypothetical protein